MPLPRRKPVTQKTAPAKTASKSQPVAKTVKKEDKPKLQLMLHTPPATAVFPHLKEKSTYFKAEGMFDCPLRFPKEPETAAEEAEMAAFFEKVEEFHAKCMEGEKRKIESPVKDGDTYEKEQHHGHWLLFPKSTFEIVVVNAMKEEIDPDTIWTGDLVRAVINFKKTWDNNGKPFCTAYLVLVQLLEKRATSAADAAYDMIDTWASGLALDEVDDTTVEEYSDDNGDF